ncbi:hypothetical protein M9H77_06967 [Catharanthus roseus]|uniref:Uncharacterized protein n=1 Tax=Catharanthus roseus TaxID=4058 RepID=A0ACC0BTV9_CATRO|nr:hypothetical protein M9H77_06967 [Catharanthus roseus]
MAYSKLAKARSNCYKDGDYDGNAYGESHIEMDTTPIGVKWVLECTGFNDFENLVTTSSSFECEVMELWKHKAYSSFSNALGLCWNQHFHYHHVFEEEHYEAFESYALFLSFNKDERMDLRMNPVKEKGYGMTHDKHENMKIFQGPTTRPRARKLEEENEEMVALLRRTLRLYIEGIRKEKMKIKEAPKHS